MQNKKQKKTNKCQFVCILSDGIQAHTWHWKPLTIWSLTASRIIGNSGSFVIYNLWFRHFFASSIYILSSHKILLTHKYLVNKGLVLLQWRLSGSSRNLNFDLDVNILIYTKKNQTHKKNQKEARCHFSVHYVWSNWK